MKNKITFLLVLLVSVAFFFSSFVAEKPGSRKAVREVPANVKTALEKSCYDCHTTGSGNEKAKEKLDFNKLGQLSKGQKTGKLRGISETIKNGEMPPKKYLDKNPDKKLTSEEVKLISDWVTAEIRELMKK